MKKSVYCLLALAMLGLTGCDDYVTPKGAVLTAAYKIKTNDVKGFTNSFWKEARPVFGTKAGFEAVEAKLASAHGFRIEDAKLVSVKAVRNGAQTAAKTYTVGVDGYIKGMNTESRLLTATVRCDIFTLSDASCPEMDASCSFQAQTNDMNGMNDVVECRISSIQ